MTFKALFVCVLTLLISRTSIQVVIKCTICNVTEDVCGVLCGGPSREVRVEPLKLLRAG